MKSECDEVWLKFSMMCMVENFHYISVTLGHMKTSWCLFYWCTEKLFFSLNFWRTHVLLMGPLIPRFCTSGDVCPRFQNQGGSNLYAFLPASYSSDSPLVWHLLTAWQLAWRPVTFPTCINRGRMLGFKWGISHSEHRCSTHSGRLYHPILVKLREKGLVECNFSHNEMEISYQISIESILFIKFTCLQCNEKFSVMKSIFKVLWKN